MTSAGYRRFLVLPGARLGALTRLACFMAIAVSVSSVQALAQNGDADAAFRRGLGARNDGRWPDVLLEMRAAIEADGAESTRKIREGLGGLFRVGGTEYLPHFFLGEAHFRQDNCARAVEAWAESERQGIVQDLPTFAGILRAGYQVCSERGILLPADYDRLYLSTRQAYTDTDAIRTRVSQLSQRDPAAWSSDLDSQYEAARQELAAAQRRLVVGTQSRSAVDFSEAASAVRRAREGFLAVESRFNGVVSQIAVVQTLARQVSGVIEEAEETARTIAGRQASLTQAMAAARGEALDALARARELLRSAEAAGDETRVQQARGLAGTAAQGLADVLDDLTRQERVAIERQVGEAVAAAVDAFSFVDAALDTFARLADARPSGTLDAMQEARDGILEQVDALRRRFERARRGDDARAIREVARLAGEAQADLEALIGTFGPLTLRDRGVAAALEDGARAFFAGQYRQVLAALDPGRGLSEIPLQAHVHMFRAAALHALYAQSGGTDQASLDEAHREVEACKRLNSALQPNARAFSPRFIAFFQQVDVSQAQTAPPGGP